MQKFKAQKLTVAQEKQREDEWATEGETVLQNNANQAPPAKAPETENEEKQSGKEKELGKEETVHCALF